MVKPVNKHAKLGKTLVKAKTKAIVQAQATAKLAAPAEAGNTSNATATLKATAAGASTASSKGKTVDIPVVAMNQYTDGQQNACGTTSLASLMNYWNPGNAANDRKAIDKAIRNGDSFSTPEDLVSYAKGHGYRAAFKTDAGLGDIRKMLDQGVPVQVLIDPGSKSDTTWHYVAVTGYETDAAGNITGLHITDPAGAKKYTMSAGEFLKKWSDLKMSGIPSGMSRVLLTYVPNDNREIAAPDGSKRKAGEIGLPSNGKLDIFNDAQPALTFSQGTNNVINGWYQKKPGKLIGGLVQVGAGAVGLGMGVVGSYTEKAGQKAMDWGKKQWKKGGLLGKVAGGTAIVGGAVVKGAGWLVKKTGNAVAWVGNKVGGAISKVGDAVGKGVKKVTKGVTNVAKKAGKAIKKAFKGW